MKIYRSITIDIDTGETVAEDSFDYDGPVDLCKSGGSTTTNTQDPKYNARMATISERQQKMAEEYFSFWKRTYKPYEEAMVEANTGLLPTLTAMQESEAGLATQLANAKLATDENGMSYSDYQVQAETDAFKSASDYAKAASDRAGLLQSTYKSAMEGYDPNAEARLSAADVSNAFSNTAATARRDLGRAGVDPNSGAYTSALAQLSTDRAKSMAGAMSQARRTAKDANFSRMTQAAALA